MTEMVIIIKIICELIIFILKNIDANRTLTLSSIIEEGKVLHPLFGENNTGIANIGNSCYINSVL